MESISKITTSFMLYAPQIYALNGFARISFKKDTQKFLDVGCGFRKLPGAVGVDADPSTDADVAHDLEKFPWPFADGEFDLILMSHVLEHLSNTAKTLREVHRVGKPGARVVIQIPYFRSPDSFSDPTHKHFFTIESETFLLAEGYERVGFWIGWPHRSRNPIKEACKQYVHQHTKF